MTAPRPARLDVTAGLLAAALAGAAAVWDLADGPRAASDAPAFGGMFVALTTTYALTGALLAQVGAARVVRRVLIAIALVLGAMAVLSTYAHSGLRSSWPGAELALWLSSWLWAPAYVAIPVLLPLLLPDGRPVWRWSGWLAGAAVLAAGLLWALTPYHLRDFPLLDVPANPVGTPAAAHPVAVGSVVGLILLATAVSLLSMVVRYRRARGVARDQLRWLLMGVLGTIALGASVFLLPTSVGNAVRLLLVLPFPAAVLIALLRHRLWDVDLVLSRSLSYGLLSSSAVGAYVVAVALIGGLIGDSAGASVLATVLVALLVLPLHGRLQLLVNRLVHGSAEDPYTALARLGDRLEAAEDPATVAARVLPELVARVAQLVRLPYVAVVLADGSTTSVGTAPAEVRSTPLLYGGVSVGELVVADAELPRRERRLLEHLSRQAAVAVHGVLLGRDVQRARAATATAREEERRRMRRDLHDGMGPALAAVALQAETARDLVRQDPEAAVALLDRLVPRLNDAVADIRTLVHDLRPPTLDELGLAGSVRELATRFATPARAVHVEAHELATLPAAVDLAAYRIVAESLANMAKHAAATSVHLALSCTTSALEVRVSDDGVGVAGDALAGVGLRSMRERAEELGGSCAVLPGEGGRGTTVLATLPLQREAS